MRYTGAPDRPRSRRARGEDRGPRSITSACMTSPSRRVATFSRGMRQRLGLAEILHEGCADRHPRRADLRPRSAGDDRAPGDHPQPEAPQRHACCCRRICSTASRASATALRCSVTATSCCIGTVGELGRQVLGGGYNVDVEAEGRVLPRRLKARSGSDAPSKWPVPNHWRHLRPIATCGRKRRPPWWAPAAGSCACRSRRPASRRSTRAISRRTSRTGGRHAA